MSYSDSQVASYNMQINTYKNRIDDLNHHIHELEDDIDDLIQVKKKAENVDSAMTLSTCSASNKILSFPAISILSATVMKVSFFDRITNLLTGNEHTNAKHRIDSTIEKITKKIKNLRDKIDQSKAEISNYREKIEITKRRKNNYIISKQAELDASKQTNQV